MPPPEEEERPPLPRPEPKPKPKPPRPKPKTGPEPKPGQAPERYWSPAGAFPPDDPLCAHTCSGACALVPRCSQPPPAPAATVHISSGRLPTPLIALSASLLAVSAVLLVALLVHRLVRRRRRRRRLALNAALAAQHDEEGGQVLAGAVAEGVGGEAEDVDGGGVHHVWYIRTKGLDERAIAAIAAVVYDAGKKRGAGAGAVDDSGDASCAVCLAEFRDGETLRLLPRCGHAFHRGCIDTWLRAHVNCPLCRAPVQVASIGGGSNIAAPGAATATPAGETTERNLRAIGGVVNPEETERGGVPEHAVRRAASMVALPRRAWPDVSFRAPASSSGREGDMTGIGKIMRLLKFSDSPEMTGVGAERSVSFSSGSCQHPPARSGSSAAGVSSDEMPR